MKRSDLTGCKVTMPKEQFSYDIVIEDENGKNVVCISVLRQANASAKFTKFLADALKKAIPTSKL
jgi:hypothetical protein